MSEPRVALVTGAARGIGAATVRALVRDGYRVVAVDACAGEGPGRPPGVDYALATRADLESVAELGQEVWTSVTDVRERADLGELLDAVIARWGRLDAVVAAAAVVAGGQPLWKTPDDHVRALWETDVLGVWNCAAVAMPHLLAGPAPSASRFVAVASAAGHHGLFGLSAYSMVKHAVVGLVKGLAADTVGTGVTVCGVSPGSTDTPMLRATAALYGLDGVEELVAHQGLRRVLVPAEIADTIAFCCSVSGASLHGSVVQADGGFGL